MYYIYKMIHRPTGRVYIGQRKCPAGKTPETDSYHGSGIAWKNIYNTHPDECVKVVVETCFTKEAVNRLEVAYIEQYKHFMGDRCVNIAPGGDGGSLPGEDNPWFGKHHSDEVRRKISDTLKGKCLSEEYRRKMSEVERGEKNHFFGKHHSDETKMKIGESLKGKLHSDEHKRKIGEAEKGEKNPMFGKRHSEEARRKMSEARKAYWKARKENAQ